jgi:UDP-glucose 4-epimerase
MMSSEWVKPSSKGSPSARVAPMTQRDMPLPEGETIFITGGAGFIGSKLAGLLVPANRVVVYDNFSRDSLKDKPFRDHPNLEVVDGDVLDPARLAEAMIGATYVVHCAGIAGIDTVVRQPVHTMKVNMIGSVNVLDAATGLSGLKRVACFSTSEVFGQLAFRSQETDPAVLGAAGEARWTYAVSKLAEEHLNFAYYRERGLPTATVRPFNVYGPGQVGEGALRQFILCALAGDDLVIHGDGTQIRAWCYIDDMVEGLLRVMTSPTAVGESFNIGNERTVITIYGLANTVIRVLDSSSAVRFVPRTSADIELRIPHVVKAKELLGFEASVDLEEGIARTAEYYAGVPS